MTDRNLTPTERMIAASAPAGADRAAFARAPEVARVAAIKSAAAVPASVGPEIPAAPARGAYQVYTPREVVPGGTTVRSGYLGRDGLRVADVFDRMAVDALRAHRKRGGADADFVDPISPGLVAMARDYGEMSRRHAAAGAKCASLEATGAGGQGSWIEAYLDEGKRLRALHRRIGDGVALSVRRVRPSERGEGKRGLIRDRTLVDSVCIEGRTLTEVLEAAGWSAWREHREALRKALCAALYRMQGHAGGRPQDVP